MAAWTERFGIAGRKALVTGASKGIGAEIAKVFADAGADIVAMGRDEADLAETAEAVRALGRRCLTITTELEDPAATRAAAERALAEWGTIDILVNNAGIALIAPALDVTLEDWDRTMAVNVRAPFVLAQTLAPAMIAQRWGKIVMISSQAGIIGIEDHASYCASKGAINTLTKQLMSEWARHNIQVNAVCPTIIMTPMGRKVWGEEAKAAPMRAATPLRRFGEPIEVADCALFLASSAAELINGELILVDGGFASV